MYRNCELKNSLPASKCSLQTKAKRLQVLISVSLLLSGVMSIKALKTDVSGGCESMSGFRFTAQDEVIASDLLTWCDLPSLPFSSSFQVMLAYVTTVYRPYSLLHSILNAITWFYYIEFLHSTLLLAKSRFCTLIICAYRTAFSFNIILLLNIRFTRACPTASVSNFSSHPFMLHGQTILTSVV